jgi:hypothetical protein
MMQYEELCSSRANTTVFRMSEAHEEALGLQIGDET